MNIENIPVRKLNIFKEMEFYNKKVRESVAENLNDKKMKIYDIGVKNAMSVLKMLIGAKDEKEIENLIYQKHGEEAHEVEEYARLSEVLTEVCYD